MTRFCLTYLGKYAFVPCKLGILPSQHSQFCILCTRPYSDEGEQYKIPLDGPNLTQTVYTDPSWVWFLISIEHMGFLNPQHYPSELTLYLLKSNVYVYQFTCCVPGCCTSGYCNQ